MDFLFLKYIFIIFPSITAVKLEFLFLFFLTCSYKKKGEMKFNFVNFHFIVVFTQLTYYYFILWNYLLYRLLLLRKKYKKIL